MCGIAGVLVVPGRSEDQAAVVQHMLDLLRHRGPDDQGTWGNQRVALGNRRLAILDLSDAGHQPMRSADGTLAVVQNGEIYNHEELRPELEAAGYRFRSRCDTEVLLHGYAHWGIDLVKRLRGMFAIAIWDERAEQLVLMRDHFGIKPLYYHAGQVDGAFRLAFASEIKPLLSLPGVAARPNLALVHDFLAQGKLEHTPDTFFEGIHKVPPAHYLRVSRDGAVTLHRYWDFEVNPEIGTASAADDAARAQAFRAVFLDSVRHHLISDVPVASCLSGGLDSSSVVCGVHHVRQQEGSPTRLTTFTSCAEDLRFDERDYAQEVIDATGVSPRFFFPAADGFLRELPQLLYHQEEPFAGTSIYAQWTLMREVNSAGLKVILDGQGGDEQLLGYGKFYLFYLQSLLRQRRLLTLLSEGLGVGLSYSFWGNLHLRHGLRYMGRLAKLSATHKLIHPKLTAAVGHAESMGLGGGFAERIKEDLTRWSLPVLLRYEDKNSMAFSVESRVPFVDRVLVEHVAALPLNQKLRRGWTKYVLRQGLDDLLPRRISRRQSKKGFETPERVWFRRELAGEIEQTFEGAEFLPEWADLPQLRKAFAAYRRGMSQTPHSVFFRYFIMEKWARQFLTSDWTQQRPPSLDDPISREPRASAGRALA